MKVSNFGLINGRELGVSADNRATALLPADGAIVLQELHSKKQVPKSIEVLMKTLDSLCLAFTNADTQASVSDFEELVKNIVEKVFKEIEPESAVEYTEGSTKIQLERDTGRILLEGENYKYRQSIDSFDNTVMFSIAKNERLYNELKACFDFQKLKSGNSFPTTPARLLKSAANILRFYQKHKIAAGENFNLDFELSEQMCSSRLRFRNYANSLSIGIQGLPGQKLLNEDGEERALPAVFNIELEANGDLNISYNNYGGKTKPKLLIKSDASLESNAQVAGKASRNKSLFSHGADIDKADLKYLRDFADLQKPILQEKIDKAYRKEFWQHFTKEKKEEPNCFDGFKKGYENYSNYSTMSLPQAITRLEKEKDFLIQYFDKRADPDDSVHEIYEAEIFHDSDYLQPEIIKENNGDFVLQAIPGKRNSYYGLDFAGDPVEFFSFKQSNTGYQIRKYQRKKPGRAQKYIELTVDGENKFLNFDSDEKRDNPDDGRPNLYNSHANEFDYFLQNLDPDCDKSMAGESRPSDIERRKLLILAVHKLGLDRAGGQNKLTTGSYKLDYHKDESGDEVFKLLSLDDELLLGVKRLH